MVLNWWWCSNFALSKFEHPSCSCVCVCFEWTAYVGQILGLKRWTKPRFVSYRSIFHIEYWTSKYTEHCSILHTVVLPEHNLISIPFIADLFLHNLEFFIQFGFRSDWNWIRSTDVTCIRRNGNVNKSEMERQKYIFFGRRCRCHHRVVVVAWLKCMRNHHLYFRKRFSCTFCQFSWYSTVSLFHVCVSECWKNVESPKNGIRAIVTCDLILVQNRRFKVMHAHWIHTYTFAHALRRWEIVESAQRVPYILTRNAQNG